MDKKFDLFSFSTSWNWRKTSDGKELMNQIMNLGFNTVELNYKVTQKMYDDIQPMVDKGILKVSSVHNVFPNVDDVRFDTDSLLLSYPSNELRKQAVELTKKTVDYGVRLNAKVVVIHPGVVPVPNEQNYDERLKDLYREGKRNSKEYKDLFDEASEYISGERDKYVELIRESMEEIGDYVLKKGYNIKLGIENRPIITQIPDFYEANYLLDKLKDYPVYFWYDVGHGIIMNEVGLFNNLEEAKKIKSRIIGMHIHDVEGVSDHWAPYIKTNRLDDYLDIIKDSPIKVLELGIKNSEEQIVKGASILEEKLLKLKSK